MIIGIDPGLSGAWALINNDGTYIGSQCFERRGDTIDCTELYGDITDYPESVRVVVEKVHAMPKNGSISAFKLGTTYGQIVQLTRSVGAPLTLILPSEWKRLVLSGYAWKKNKMAALDFVMDRYPKFPRGTNKAKALARAEAVCIALSVLAR